MVGPPLRNVASRTERVLFVSPELPPWVKSGGLGDVTAALPAALAGQGLDTRLLVPGYGAALDALATRVELARIPAYAAFPEATLVGGGEVHGVPLMLVDCPAFFRRGGTAYQDLAFHDWHDNDVRFGLLSRVAALIGQGLPALRWRPDVVHCNDWPCGLAPAYVAIASAPRAATVMAIHNLSHQGVFDVDMLDRVGLPRELHSMHGLEYYGRVSFMKAGLYYAHRLVTVSPTYAREIQTDPGGQGLGGLLRARAPDLAGILNGIDVSVWDPAHDTRIAHVYDAGSLAKKSVNKLALQRRLGLAPGEEHMLLGVVSRLADQKGIDWLLAIAPRLLALPVQLAILGSGERTLEAELAALAARHPARIGALIGFDNDLAHLIEAGADAFVMPSRFEPCGLNQMYSLRYGTPPIVRATGGLADTVVDASPATIAAGTANGFAFHESSAEALQDTIVRAVAAWRDRALWRKLQQSGMARDFSWGASAVQYKAVYDAALAAARG